MTKGYVNVWKNCLTLYLAKISEFQKVNEFCMVFSELPFMRYVYLYYYLKVFYVMILTHFSWRDFLFRILTRKVKQYHYCPLYFKFSDQKSSGSPLILIQVYNV